MKGRLLAALLLFGCGGRPAPAPEPTAGGVEWTAVHGGAWVSTCVWGQEIVALRAGGLDRWTVTAEGPLTRAKSLPLPWPTTGAPGRSVQCPTGEAAPLAVHLMANNILCFHAVIWPCMLHALG